MGLTNDHSCVLLQKGLEDRRVSDSTSSDTRLNPDTTLKRVVLPYCDQLSRLTFATAVAKQRGVWTSVT